MVCELLVKAGALEKCARLKKFLELKNAKTALPVKRWTLQPPNDGAKLRNCFSLRESDIGPGCGKLSIRALKIARYQ